MAQFGGSFGTFWSGLEHRSRAGLVAGMVAIIACVVVLSWWLLKRDYQALFTGLEQRDAAAIVTELKRLKVPYRIDADGTTIRVPAEVVHETRLNLMGRGVNLSGGVGFEIFDNKDLGMTEYTQKINYQRALQGELARTIMAIEDVKLARVHLVLTDSSIFKRDKTRPKASVSVVLKPGGRLTSEQILGIQRLVAAAAPSLESGMVTVLDQRGVTLSAASEGEGATALAGGQLRIKQEVEQYLTHKAGEVLDRAFGPGQAIVSVDVALNFDEVRRTVQDVVPARTGAGEESGVVVHKRQALQHQTRPGVAATADDTYRREEAGNSSSTLEVDYDVSRRVEQVVTTPGSVRRLSVGVLVPHGLREEQAARLRAVVAMAVGLDERRGDAIAVHAIDQFLAQEAHSAPLAEPALAEPRNPEPAVVPAPKKGLLVDWSYAHLWSASVAIAAVCLVVGVLLAHWLAVRRRAASSPAPADMDERQRLQLLAEVRAWLGDNKGDSLDGIKS